MSLVPILGNTGHEARQECHEQGRWNPEYPEEAHRKPPVSQAIPLFISVLLSFISNTAHHLHLGEPDIGTLQMAEARPFKFFVNFPATKHEKQESSDDAVLSSYMTQTPPEQQI